MTTQKYFPVQRKATTTSRDREHALDMFFRVLFRESIQFTILTAKGDLYMHEANFYYKSKWRNLEFNSFS